MAESDSLYHRLFSHPIMVEQLVREFVPEAMSVGLDFARMVRVNAKFHSQKGKRRDGDVIWCLPTNMGTDIYLYFLIEFQSSINEWMSVRTQVYTGMLWQQIINTNKLKRGNKLPPVLPIVLYNGDQRWNAPLNVTDLIDISPNSPLWPWQPAVRYYLLDEGAFPKDDLVRRETLTALLFRLEHCYHLDDLVGLIDEVLRWFRSHPGYDALKQLFTEVVAQAAYDIGGDGKVKIPEGLLEVRNMLATRTQVWKQQLVAEGEARGKAEMLLRLLYRRFMTLPSGLEDRIRAASSDQLDEWSERFADGLSLTEIFGLDLPH
ncbi:MAG: Rpn family recombination-promoting nuclease/putative transposase [Rhodospirillaceae bacterium]